LLIDIIILTDDLYSAQHVNSKIKNNISSGRIMKQAYYLSIRPIS